MEDIFENSPFALQSYEIFSDSGFDFLDDQFPVSELRPNIKKDNCISLEMLPTIAMSTYALASSEDASLEKIITQDDYVYGTLIAATHRIFSKRIDHAMIVPKGTKDFLAQVPDTYLPGPVAKYIQSIGPYTHDSVTYVPDIAIPIKIDDNNLALTTSQSSYKLPDFDLSNHSTTVIHILQQALNPKKSTAFLDPSRPTIEQDQHIQPYSMINFTDEKAQTPYPSQSLEDSLNWNPEKFSRYVKFNLRASSVIPSIMLKNLGPNGSHYTVCSVLTDNEKTSRVFTPFSIPRRGIQLAAIYRFRTLSDRSPRALGPSYLNHGPPELAHATGLYEFPVGMDMLHSYMRSTYVIQTIGATSINDKDLVFPHQRIPRYHRSRRERPGVPPPKTSSAYCI